MLLLEKLPKQLAETGIKSPFFSTLAVIRFPSEEQFENWQAPAAQALGDKASIKRVDLVVADGLQDAPRPGAYFAVNLYETLVPAETAHRSCSACLLAHIGMKLGHKLAWDPKAERFVNDDAANAMLARAERAPYGTRRAFERLSGKLS